MKLYKHQDKSDVYSTRRVESITDCVFSVAMTLLVLDLKIPYGTAIKDPQQLLNYFSQQSAVFRNFVISFVLLAVMWAIHVRQFEHIKKVDRHAIMVNSVRLFLVVLIPFTASLSGNYPDIVLARELLAVNFFFLAAVSFWQWYYMAHNPDFSDELTQEDAARGMWRNGTFVVVAALVCVLVVPFGEYAYFAYFLIPIVLFFVTRNRHAAKT